MKTHYQAQSLPALAALLTEEDAITYSVLRQILKGECADVFTDGKNWIACHSRAPYPVWVWCRDGEDGTLAETIGRCIKEKFPLEKGFVVILSVGLRRELARVDSYFANTQEKMDLLSYRLKTLAEPPARCGGGMRLVRSEEIEGLIPCWIAMQEEMDGIKITADHARTTMGRFVEQKGLYAWHNAQGQLVAMCARGDQTPYSKVSAVYTLPEHRRKGYCQNLVWSVTKEILDDGYCPILYTDADYAASNACYQKIGYRQIGRLTSIQRK